MRSGQAAAQLAPKHHLELHVIRASCRSRAIVVLHKARVGAAERAKHVTCCRNSAAPAHCRLGRIASSCCAGASSGQQRLGLRVRACGGGGDVSRAAHAAR